eukprot:TRINITY_DN18773_c0_g1_i7.p1 TRINITY_DN18773_c0_g1~~TRINITY_DN18773_c0_g1_i7.p1  ORF type:complete len:205 (+),score=26.36 TRINITY_DN18773_c0_g1_i7:168-782(+)
MASAVSSQSILPEECSPDTLVPLLRNYPPFAHCGTDLLGMFAAAFSPAKLFRRGDVLVRRGAPATGWHLVLEGSVGIVGHDSSGVEREVATLSAIDSFGIFEIGTKQRLTAADVIARTPGRFLSAPRERFEELLEFDSAVLHLLAEACPLTCLRQIASVSSRAAAELMCPTDVLPVPTALSVDLEASLRAHGFPGVAGSPRWSP